MKIKLSLMFLSALSLAGTGALAQIAPGDPAGNKTIPEKDQLRPSDAPSGGQQGGGEKDGSNLSDKLDESGGVLKPKPGNRPGDCEACSRSASKFDTRNSTTRSARRAAGTGTKIIQL